MCNMKMWFVGCCYIPLLSNIPHGYLVLPWDPLHLGNSEEPLF